MAARFDWAVPTILGNNDEPVLGTDVATKAYVDANSGGGNSIVNGNTSVIANPANVVFSAGRANNFTFGHEPEGTILYFEQDVGVNSFIQTIPGTSGLNICNGLTVTLNSVEPFSGDETLGSPSLRWDNVYADNIDVLGTIVAATGNIGNINANTIIANTINTSGGNISANAVIANTVNANSITSNSISTPKLFQSNTVAHYSCNETAVAANTTIVVPWTVGTFTSTDFNFIQVGGVTNGGIRNASTDTLVVSVAGSILWNQNSNTQGTRITTLYLNDSIYLLEQDAVPAGSTFACQPFSTTMVLAPGQYVAVYTTNQSGGSANIGGAVSGVISAPTNRLNVTVLARR
jgi:hypothetical protein